MNKYRISECLNRETLKPYFAVQRYNMVQREWMLFLDKQFETLEEATEAVRLLKKYQEPIYHYVD
jgi:hypothetical protein